MEEIETTMKDASVLQRQIPPLSRRMYEGLKSFISLDLPFRLGEREEKNHHVGRRPKLSSKKPPSR